MDPAANTNREPDYLTIAKGVAFVAVILLLLALLGSYVFIPRALPPAPEANESSPIASPSETGTPSPPPAATEENIELRGTQTCLTHKDTTGPQTMECAIGLAADDGYNYALDTSALQPDAVNELYGGGRVRIRGWFVPAEALSADHFQKYQMRGIVRVTLIERI